MPTSTYMHVCACTLSLVSRTSNVYTLMMSMNVCMCACQHNILYYVLTLMPTTLPLSPPNTYTHTTHIRTHTYLHKLIHTYPHIILLIDHDRGTWSSPDIAGEGPPPCTGASLTKMDSSRAAMFGGYDAKQRQSSADMYILNFLSWVRALFSVLYNYAWTYNNYSISL